MAGAKGIKAGSAFVEIYANETPLVRGLKSAETRLKNFASTTDRAGAGIGRIGAGVASLGAIGISALAWPLQLAANMESAEASFTTLLKDGQKAKALMAELKAFAEETPFQFDEIADAAKKLLAFGSDAKNVQGELRRIGDVSSAIGAPIGEIVEIYGKARVQGRLFAEDINQLTGRGIPIIQELAKQFGVTDQEVKKLVENGQVNFGNLEKAFISLTSGAGKFAGGMKRQSEGLIGLFSTLKDKIISAFLPFGQALAPAAKAALGIASAAVSKFAKWAEQNKDLAIPLAAASIALVGIGSAAVAAGVALIGVGQVVSALNVIVAGTAALVGGTLGAAFLPVIAAGAGLLSIAGYIAYIGHQAGFLGPILQFLGSSFDRVFGVAQRTIKGVSGALMSGEWGKAAQIAWAGVKLASLVGAQQVLIGIDALWNNAGKITFKFFKALNSTVAKVFSNLPKIAFAALRGGDALANAISAALGSAFDGGNLNLAKGLDKAIADAQQTLNRLTPRQRQLGRQQPANNNGQQPGIRQPQFGRTFAPQQSGQSQLNVGRFVPQGLQQPPRPQAGEFPPIVSRPIPQVSTVAGAVNASARPTAGFGGQEFGGGSSELAQLVSLAQAQLIAQRRLVAMGGLS